MATLTCTQKAAMLLLQLGLDLAARVMAQLDVTEIEELTVEIMRLERIDQTMADDVLEEFYDVSVIGPVVGGGMAYAQALLESSLGTELAAGMLERLQTSMAGQPFEFLQHADARQVISLISGEHPQAVALVLAHLRP